ncbi:MAG TPA: tetratricopeptide repeat protein [Symbiobacteriaceae bacterium]|nr:tetratricopeptide repeat protein [Symbiobacteriaceae bacterium]
MISDRERRQLGDGARQLLGLYEQGQHPHLLNEVEMLSKAGPLPADVLGMASLSLSAVERYADAARAAREAAEAAPSAAWLYDALAAAEAGQGRLEAAVAAQRRAVQLLPGEAGYGAALAGYLRRAGEIDLAARTARQALLTAPEHAGALCELGLALAAGGDRAGALEQFRLAQQADPASPQGHLQEGVLLLLAGERRAARPALHAALKRRPGLTEAEDRLAGTLGGFPPVWVHLLNLGRVTVVGWAMIAFLYYLLFRLLEFLWKTWPVLLPAGRILLVVTLTYLLGGMLVGRLMRFAFRRGWPR